MRGKFARAEEEFSLKQAKLVKRKSVDPFNANEQGNAGSVNVGMVMPTYNTVILRVKPEGSQIEMFRYRST